MVHKETVYVRTRIACKTRKTGTEWVMADESIEHIAAGHEALERAISLLKLSGVAEACSVAYQIVQGWRSKERRVATPAEYASAIEIATGGQVTRQELRPNDWHRIWPELPGAAERLAAERPKAAA